MFGLSLLPQTTGAGQPFLTSPQGLHSSGSQKSASQVPSNATATARHNFSDAPISSSCFWCNLFAATFVLLSPMFVTICLKILWPILWPSSRKQWSDTQFIPLKRPWNIQDSCSLLTTSCTTASDTCTMPSLTTDQNGIHACHSISDAYLRACAAINLEASYPEHRVGMIDSG